jgi:hypothetical protein
MARELTPTITVGAPLTELPRFALLKMSCEWLGSLEQDMVKARPRKTDRRLSRKDVVRLVEKYLAPHQPRGYRMNVQHRGVEHHDGWWYVTVLPSREDVPSHDFHSRLTETSLELGDRERLNVFLIDVPAGNGVTE